MEYEYSYRYWFNFKGCTSLLAYQDISKWKSNNNLNNIENESSSFKNSSFDIKSLPFSIKSNEDNNEIVFKFESPKYDNNDSFYQNNDEKLNADYENIYK